MINKRNFDQKCKILIVTCTGTHADNNRGFGAVRDSSAKEETLVFLPFTSLQVLFQIGSIPHYSL